MNPLWPPEPRYHGSVMSWSERLDMANLPTVEYPVLALPWVALRMLQSIPTTYSIRITRMFLCMPHRQGSPDGSRQACRESQRSRHGSRHVTRLRAIPIICGVQKYMRGRQISIIFWIHQMHYYIFITEWRKGSMEWAWSITLINSFPRSPALQNLHVPGIPKQFHFLSLKAPMWPI